MIEDGLGEVFFGGRKRGERFALREREERPLQCLNVN